MDLPSLFNNSKHLGNAQIIYILNKYIAYSEFYIDEVFTTNNSLIKPEFDFNVKVMEMPGDPQL